MKRNFVIPLVVGFAIFTAACSNTSTSSDTNLTPAALAGKKIAASRCLGCHSLDGKSRSGPTFKGLAGSTVQLKDGSSITADRDYLVESTVNPSAKVVAGYADLMGAAVPKGQISQEDAAKIAEYIESIR